ncbi:MAG TPA: SRPBCC family protein [Dehalococcoidia bacterium]|nr:SRPBCC family protein [Dehalococcoidia bacterium]
MPRLDNAIEIKAPRDKVFAYISDVTTHPEWVKWTKQAEMTSPPSHVGVGTTYAGVMQVGPKKENIEEIVTEYKDGQLFTRRHTRGMDMTDRLAVVNTPDGAKVAWSVEYTPPMGAMGKMMDVIFMSTLFNQLMEDSLTNLKDRLESAR